MPSIQILFVEDQQLIAEAIHQLIRGYENINIVSVAHNYEEAIRQLIPSRLDLILLDINIPRYNHGKPQMAGFDVLEYIRKQKIDTKVIVLSNHADEDIIKRANKLGAKAYLLKNTSPKELYRAILAVYNGETYESKINFNQADNTHAAVFFCRLTKREKEVASMVSKGGTNQEIANKLGLQLSTVVGYRENIIEKLGAKNTPDMVRIIFQNGLLD
jgi:DNA-binding NarL/FixJ family response regulator